MVSDKLPCQKKEYTMATANDTIRCFPFTIEGPDPPKVYSLLTMPKMGDMLC